MNISRAILIISVLMCGAGIGRPAQAFFTTQQSIQSQLYSADWVAPTSFVSLGDEQYQNGHRQQSNQWKPCDQTQSVQSNPDDQPLLLSTQSDQKCAQLALSFSATEVAQVSFEYVLSTSSQVDFEPVARLYWNNNLVAWLSRLDEQDSMVTIALAPFEREGVFMVELSRVGDEHEYDDLSLFSPNTNTIILKPEETLRLQSNEHGSTVCYAFSQSMNNGCGLNEMLITAPESSAADSLMIWSVDQAGNTESPQQYPIEVWDFSADQHPAIIWQVYEGGELFVIVQTEPNLSTSGLVLQYLLETADFQYRGSLANPLVDSDLAQHELGSTVGLRFSPDSSQRGGRVLVVDQTGTVLQKSEYLYW